MHHKGIRSARITWFATSRGQAASKYPRSGPPLQQQVLAIAGASWPVEPGSAS
jgi:hypothetical protein